jgi:cobaltochelatase CobS
MSDLLAQNNVYLYGGAGTGKSFIAEKIGEELLNCKVYTLPCNQYTSPLDLIGGQTIEGYVEGIVTRAYGNLDVPDDKDGALLLLDEMPKLDPNTAGVLNDMLAKIKRGAPITNGRQQLISKGKKVYVMATGNILLNREDPAYSGNTKQDLSLQDRFAGSCYEFIIELYSEKASMMGFLFIWNYLTKLRFLIAEKKYDNFAFVSRRLMESLRDTQAFYMAQKKRVPTEGMKEFPAKTVIQGMESFFDLFLPEQIVALKTDSNYDAWKREAIKAMNRPADQEFVDTIDEVKESDILAEKYMKIQLAKYKYLNPEG